MYGKRLALKPIVNAVKRRTSQIKVNEIQHSGQIQNLIRDNPNSLFSRR